MLLVWSESQSTYICRVQSCVCRLPNYWPPNPLFHPASVASPAPKAGEGEGYTLAGRWGGGGQYFGRRQTLVWPLTIISLRSEYSYAQAWCIYRGPTQALKVHAQAWVFWVRVFYTKLSYLDWWLGDWSKKSIILYFCPRFRWFFDKISVWMHAECAAKIFLKELGQKLKVVVCFAFGPISQ